jgi:predicted transcriptional regulator
MNKIQKLPESELLIMQVLWKSKEPIGSSSITELLNDDVSWKPSTLATLISRLTDKGFIKAEKDGRYLVYSPIISEEEYLKVETKSFFKKLHKSSLKSFITALYDSHGISDDDIDEMLTWLKNKDRR